MTSEPQLHSRLPRLKRTYPRQPFLAFNESEARRESPLRIAIELRARSHDVQTVGEEGLTGRADADIWQASQREGRILITQDLDFSDSRKFQPGSHHGIVLIRLRSPSRKNLIARANELFDTEDVSGWGGCFVVVTERKIRIRRPDPSRN